LIQDEKSKFYSLKRVKQTSVSILCRLDKVKISLSKNVTQKVSRVIQRLSFR